MDIESIIFENLLKKKKITTSRIVDKTGFSHAYVHRIFQKLIDNGNLFKTGSTKNAKYYMANTQNIKKAKGKVNYYSRVFKDIAGLEANNILEDLKKKMSFTDVSKNAEEIFDYGFTEMSNNAIRHSETQRFNLKVELNHDVLSFEIRDFGTGIWNNIKQRMHLSSHNDAITELLKVPSGKGIYFTSKAADTLVFQSSEKKLIYNNLLDDIFIRTIKEFKGTKVKFNINIDTERTLQDVFKKQTGIDYAIDSAKVLVKHFQNDSKYLSRTEAQKILMGMEKFKTIILDFKDVEQISQGFADEVFNVWTADHPGIEIKIENAGEDVMFWKAITNDK